MDNPVNDQLSVLERKMFLEIHSVIKKYEVNTRKFGLHMIHSHFPISENEILFECNDSLQRTLTIKPVEKEMLTKVAVATEWSFADDGKAEVTKFCCEDDE